MAVTLHRKTVGSSRIAPAGIRARLGNEDYDFDEIVSTVWKWFDSRFVVRAKINRLMAP